MDLKLKKVDDNKWIAHNPMTSDPVAVVTAHANTYGKGKTYHAKWHPAMRIMHPETGHLVNMNISSAESADQMLGRVNSAYTSVVDHGNADPLPTEYDGNETLSVKTGYGDETVDKKFSRFKVFHGEDKKHVADVLVDNNHLHQLGTKDWPTSSAGRHLKFRWHVSKPSNERLATLTKKHNVSSPEGVLELIKDHIDNPTKEPKFVGQYSHGDHSMWKTTLPKDVAVDEFIKHLKESRPSKYGNAIVNKISPHHAIIESLPAAGDQYSMGFKDLIDASVDGHLQHTSSKIGGPEHYNSKRLDSVVE